MNSLTNAEIASAYHDRKKLGTNEWGIKSLHPAIVKFEKFFSNFRRPDIKPGMKFIQSAASTGILIAGHNLYHYENLDWQDDRVKVIRDYEQDRNSLTTPNRGKKPVFKRIDENFLGKKIE